MLFRAGNPEEIIKSCHASKIGKQLPDDLYVHIDYIDRLHPLLRVYVGCAQMLSGDIAGANVVKIHMRSGKVSYLVYKNFETDPHPRLLTSTTIMMRRLHIRMRNYADSENPPILHRKETFVASDHPKYKLFASLTKAEEKADLLKDAWQIGARKAWEDRLQKKGIHLKGHKLIAANKDALTI